MITIVHVFLIDFNNLGHLFRTSIEGDKEILLQELYKCSNDVRFVKSSKNRHRNDKGTRKFAGGTIVACTWECDKVNTFSGYKSKYIDERSVLL